MSPRGRHNGRPLRRQILRCTRSDAGRCALRKEWIWRTARGIRSLGSFQGNMLTSAFGASIALSMATAYGWAGDIVRQNQNRGLATTDEIPCHGEDEVGVGLEHPGHEFVGRRHRDLGPLGSQCRTPGLPEYAWILRVAHLRPPPTGCASTAAATRLGARFRRLQMKGPPMQKPITMNLSMPR